mgnify:CR=1 FL=1
MLSKIIKNSRAFARFSKGSFGKEGNLAANSGMPKHKELFSDGYYAGQFNDVDSFEALARQNESPIDKKMRQENEHYKNDSVKYGDEVQKGVAVEGGVLKRYRKLQNESRRDMVEGDYWRVKEQL